MTSTSTPLSATAVAACSGGAAVAGASQAVSGSGVQTVPATGLTASTNYYAQSANLSPEQWYSNAVVSSQFTTDSEGASGDNADRINIALNGISIPFSANYPADPVTTTPSTVNNSSELSSALASGARITLNNANYGSVFINSSTADVELIAANPGGAVFSSLRIDGDRVRLDGIRISGATDLTQGPTDLLFDDVHITHGAGTQPTVYIGNSFARVAFINSTIINTADAWPFLYAGGLGVISQDFFLINSFTNSTSGSANNDTLRLAHTSRLVFVNNWHQAAANGANQFRLHNEIEDILLDSNIHVEGAIKLFIDIAGDGVGGGYARRFWARNNTFYDTFVSGDDGPFTSMSNNGAVTSGLATNNNHYSSAQTSGTSTMNQGPTSWSTFTSNTRRVYQSPPTRTAGASH